MILFTDLLSLFVLSLPQLHSIPSTFAALNIHGERFARFASSARSSPSSEPSSLANAHQTTNPAKTWLLQQLHWPSLSKVRCHVLSVQLFAIRSHGPHNLIFWGHKGSSFGEKACFRPTWIVIIISSSSQLSTNKFLFITLSVPHASSQWLFFAGLPLYLPIFCSWVWKFDPDNPLMRSCCHMRSHCVAWAWLLPISAYDYSFSSLNFHLMRLTLFLGMQSRRARTFCHPNTTPRPRPSTSLWSSEPKSARQRPSKILWNPLGMRLSTCT